ncbi:hypothetical protein ACVWWO_007768 [Bradyrhizobium sp. F1.13.1]
MPVKLSLSALKQTRWYEYGIRFLLGGLATVLTGVLGARFGVSVGGLFLALPAIFCASATLVESHERRTKEKAGLSGTRRGQEAAALDAAGAAWGKHRSPGIRCRLSFHRGRERSGRFRCRVDSLDHRFGLGLVAQAQASHRLPQIAPISPFAIVKGLSPCEALARFGMR